MKRIDIKGVVCPCPGAVYMYITMIGLEFRLTVELAALEHLKSKMSPYIYIGSKVSDCCSLVYLFKTTVEF